MKKKTIASFLLAITILSLALTAYAAIRGSTCDYGDGGEMIYTGTTPWEAVLSYYDVNHEVKWLIRRYRIYTCNINHNHVDRIAEIKNNIPTSELPNYGIH